MVASGLINMAEHRPIDSKVEVTAASLTQALHMNTTAVCASYCILQSADLDLRSDLLTQDLLGWQTIDTHRI